jgi:hypothetical protein
LITKGAAPHIGMTVRSISPATQHVVKRKAHRRHSRAVDLVRYPLFWRRNPHKIAAEQART